MLIHRIIMESPGESLTVLAYYWLLLFVIEFSVKMETKQKQYGRFPECM